VSNYLEFERTLNTIATEFMIRPHLDYHSFGDERVTINRIVVNLLGACRLYLDHGDHHLSVVDATVEGVRDEFNQQRNQAYDGNGEYRICEGLRNHTQHRGFPIGSVRWGGGGVERKAGIKALLRTVEPLIDIVAMRDDPKTKKIVLADLEKLGKDLNARPILRKYISLISMIHHYVRGKIDAGLKAAEARLEQAIDDFKGDLGGAESIVGLHVIKVHPDGKREGMTAIFPEDWNTNESMEARAIRQSEGPSAWQRRSGETSRRHCGTRPCNPRETGRTGNRR
jgi:hypothetical protein